MFGALIAYALIFFIGYLILVLTRKKVSILEVIFLSFMLGTSNVIFILMVFGIAGRLDIGVYTLLIEATILLFLVFRKNKSLTGLVAPKLILESISSNVPFVLLIIIGLSLPLTSLWAYSPNVAWDSLKFYLPWTTQLYELNLIPNFDYTFNAGEPLGHSISFVSLGYLLYFFNGRVNESLVYTISPIYSAMTTLMVYVFVRKLLNDRRLGYVGAAIFALLPLNISVGSIPYVDAMLSFYILAFFFFLDSPRLSAVAASLSILTKYSGFVLPLLLMGYLFHKRKIRMLPLTLFILALITVPWYLRNILLYNNPLPFMASTVKIFENPPEAFDILVRYGSQMNLFNPTANALGFFITNNLLVMLSRLIVLAYVLYAVVKKKATAFYMLSFLSFLVIFWLSGERDVRYLLPFYPICLIAFMDILKRVKIKTNNIWYHVLFGISIALFSMSFLDNSGIQYLFQIYTLVALSVWGFISLVITWRWPQGLPPLVIPMKFIIVVGLISSIVFSVMTQSYVPMVIVKDQLPNWQSGLIELIEHIRSLPDKNQGHFLMIEDPGIRYYADINSYELTDAYGPIRLNDLFDSPKTQIVFFGLDSRRMETQKASVLEEESDYENVNNVEAAVDHVVLRFPELQSGEYVLITKYKGSGYIEDHGSLPTSNKTWNTFFNKFMVEDYLFMVTLTKTNWLMLQFVLLVPSKLYSGNYANWLLTVLENHDIDYIILSNVLSQVWVYHYYSIFAFIHLPESSTLFERIYTSDYWELYKVNSTLSDNGQVE